MSVRGGVCDIRPRFWCHGQRTSGYPWFSWISMDIYRHPWTSIEILAIREVSMDTHGCSWISWIFTGIRYIHGYQSIQKRYPWQCICIDSQQRVGASPCIIQVQEPWGVPEYRLRISRAYPAHISPDKTEPRHRIVGHPHRLRGAYPPQGCQWIPMDIHGIAWCMDIHGYPWMSKLMLEYSGVSNNTLVCHGSMDIQNIQGYPQIFVDIKPY